MYAIIVILTVIIVSCIRNVQHFTGDNLLKVITAALKVLNISTHSDTLVHLDTST